MDSSLHLRHIFWQRDTSSEDTQWACKAYEAGDVAASDLLTCPGHDGGVEVLPAAPGAP